MSSYNSYRCLCKILLNDPIKQFSMRYIPSDIIFVKNSFSLHNSLEFMIFSKTTFIPLIAKSIWLSSPAFSGCNTMLLSMIYTVSLQRISILCLNAFSASMIWLSINSKLFSNCLFREDCTNLIIKFILEIYSSHLGESISISLFFSMNKEKEHILIRFVMKRLLVFQSSLIDLT